MPSVRNNHDSGDKVRLLSTILWARHSPNSALMRMVCRNVFCSLIVCTDGWTASCSSHFTPAGLGGWLRAQMRSYSRRLFWTWTVEQVAGLSPLGASGISPAAAKGLPPALCKGFHASQIAFFRDFYTQCVCEQWSPACLANISPAEYVGFTQLCMQRLRTDALAVLTAEQVKNINPVTFGAISPKQVRERSARTATSATCRACEWVRVACVLNPPLALGFLSLSLFFSLSACDVGRGCVLGHPAQPACAVR
jgi:hypothetical protein